ncbi:MAG: hypothetical protein ACE14P_09910 [Methanotrichaceae archaeon]
MLPHKQSDKTAKILPPQDYTALLKATDAAWQQYKQDRGKRITSEEELKEHIDSL